MKKAYLKMPSRQSMYGAPIKTRRMPFVSFAAAAYRSHGKNDPGDDDEEDELGDDASDELKAIATIGKQVKKFEKLLGDAVNKEELEALNTTIADLKKGLDTLTGQEILSKMNEINTKNESLWKQVVELQEQLAEQKEKGTGKASKEGGELFKREDLENFIKGVFPDGPKGRKANKAEDPAHESFEIKAAEIMGYPQTFTDTADVTAFTGREIDRELYQRRRKSNLILDHFNIPTISVPTLIYLRKVEEGAEAESDPGGADWILCGDPKPQRSFKLTTGEVTAKKVAIFGTVEDCLLSDVASMENWIREDFTDEMRETINDGLLNNNPGVNPDAPLGMKTNAVQYSVTPAYDSTIDDPNYIDAIIAAIAFQRYNKEATEKVFIASDVYYRIHHLKATDNQWLNNNLVYVNNLGQLFIAGVRIIAVDEEDVPSTHLLAVSRDPGFKMRRYENMTFERGMNGEDFRHDRTSYRAWARFLTYFPEDREYSVLYDTFANIFAAITSATT